MRSLTEYREMLDRIKGGTIPATLALEIVEAWEQDVEQAQGEYTITQAMEVSGRSRGWFHRRVESWAQQRLARKLPSGQWLVRTAAVPRRRVLPRGGIDPSLSPRDAARRLLAG